MLLAGEAIELFKSETEFQRLHIKVQNVLESGVCEVDIFSEEDENLGHLLCAEGFAKRQQKIIEGSAKPSREQLPNLKGIHVRVVCIDSPCSLHVNLMASSNEFECLVDEMLEYGTQNCDSRFVHLILLLSVRISSRDFCKKGYTLVKL